jgi:hypothetical protein
MKVTSRYHTTRYEHDGAIFDHWISLSAGTHGVVPVRRCPFDGTEAVADETPIRLLGWTLSVDTDSAVGGGRSVAQQGERVE